jgi:hypothetical protein
MSGIKMSVFLRRFQKFKLTLGAKCAKKVITEKLFLAQKNGQVP